MHKESSKRKGNLARRRAIESRKRRKAKATRAQAALVIPAAKAVPRPSIVVAQTSAAPSSLGVVPKFDGNIAAPIHIDGIPSPRKTLAAGAVAVACAALLLLPAVRPRWLALAVTRPLPVKAVSVDSAAVAVPPGSTADPIAVAGAANEIGPQVEIAAEEGSAGLVEPPSPALALQSSPESASQTAVTPPDRVANAGLHLEQLTPAPAQQPIAAIEYEAPRQLSDSEMSNGVCTTGETPVATSPAPADPVEFGRALASAAAAQMKTITIYSDKYRSLAFPMGDVPRIYGVCTDVVIRAYRALGIDLQARVHAARIGSGDVSIAHRRVFTLRRYFASRGASLPVTNFGEDYLPGDIVTYYRPQNSGSRDHIAIVAAEMGPSGLPMIIHNRGWGVQMEDALFVNQVTGHYRYTRAHDLLALPVSLGNAMRKGAFREEKRVRPGPILGRRTSFNWNE